MTITVELPDDLAQHEDPSREALEAVAVEAYRTGAMSKGRAAALIGMGRIEFDGVLKRHNINEGAYGMEDFLQDVKTSDELKAARYNP